LTRPTSYASQCPPYDVAEPVHAGRLGGVSNVNLSKMKTGKISAIRFSTLVAICEALHCQPGDILEYDPDGDE